LSGASSNYLNQANTAQSNPVPHDPDLRRLLDVPLVTISALEDWIDRAIRRNVSFGERAASAACSQGNAAAYALTSDRKVQQARELLAPVCGWFTEDLHARSERGEGVAGAVGGVTHLQMPFILLVAVLSTRLSAFAASPPKAGYGRKRWSRA
jgi:hypothetical protein